MQDFEVSGWRPVWMSAAEQLQHERAALQGITGARLVEGWIAWNHEHDEWFADLPVVLRFEDGRQLELCWQKLDDLSITWNTIDVSVRPVAWVTWPLSWRASAHPSIVAVTGDLVERLAVTEHLFTTTRLEPGRESDTQSAWLIGGLWMETPTSGLHIFNALDENGLSNDLGERDARNRLSPI